MPLPAVQQTGTPQQVSHRFVMTWSLFACLWAAWVLSSNLSMDHLLPLFAEAPPFPDQQTREVGGYAEALTAYGLHRIERNDALVELWSLAARAFGPPLVIVALLVIADIGTRRVLRIPGRDGPSQTRSGAVRIALLLWMVLSGLWVAALALRNGASQLAAAPHDAFGPPMVALMVGVFLYGICLPVRDRG